MDLLSVLYSYRPWNPQEARDTTELLRRLEAGEDLFHRENTAAHLTASAWVVSPDRTRVLMAYHNLYDSWAWLGGHADGEEDLLSCGRSGRRAAYPPFPYVINFFRWKSCQSPATKSGENTSPPTST